MNGERKGKAMDRREAITEVAARLRDASQGRLSQEQATAQVREAVLRQERDESNHNR